MKWNSEQKAGCALRFFCLHYQILEAVTSSPTFAFVSPKGVSKRSDRRDERDQIRGVRKLKCNSQRRLTLVLSDSLFTLSSDLGFSSLKMEGKWGSDLLNTTLRSPPSSSLPPSLWLPPVLEAAPYPRGCLCPRGQPPSLRLHPSSKSPLSSRPPPVLEAAPCP